MTLGSYGKIERRQRTDVTTQAKTATVAPYAPRISAQLVAFDTQGELHLHRLNRRVVQIRNREVDDIGTIGTVTTAPATRQWLGFVEEFARCRISARHAVNGHLTVILRHRTIGKRQTESAHDHIRNTRLRLGARTHRAWRVWIEQRALGQDD